MPDQPLLTPKQVRAARALLAWSQQDLAKKAGVAPSTVADFERGHRTPVPNNAEAMRTALTGAGVTFLPGGAIMGPPLPSIAAYSQSGAPIRWVNATDLAQWAERRDGQGSLPTLLAKLIRAATGPSTHLRFPSDEGVQYPDWDGTTRSDIETDYVPAGSSGWELGTQREGIAAKATEDYRKRTAEPGEIQPADSAFIFVTPRHWPKKDEWARDRRGEGKWRDVRAYDGDDLVHWIELYPAVGQWLATALGKRPVGTLQLEEVWLEWSLATQWPLTPDLVLSDRDEDAAEVLRWLRSEPSPLSIQGETADEVVSFFYAAIKQLPQEIGENYLVRCVVATTAESARMLADGIPPLIIVLLDPDPGLAQLIAKRGYHILLAYGGNPNLRGSIRKLARPSQEGIEHALISAGIAAPRARSLAREASRSLAILRRLIPAAPGRLPEWAKQAPPQALLAALLAGAWDETSEGDKRVLTRLSNEPYDTFVSKLAPFVSSFDSPLRKVGEAWKVASPQDAWFLLAPYLSPADIEKFVSITIDVLGAADPTFNLDPNERWLASIKGVVPEYSAFLRHGLGEILILLSLFGDRLQTVSSPRTRADYVVRQLLHAADKQRWWSLSRYFQLLAEASPAAFLDAIDEGLSKNDPPITILFGEDGSPIFGGEHISNLLWALESLAWSPEYLARITEILATLDALDPGGKFSNRPGNSLRQIFLIWAPQTNATFEQRLRVLDRLRISRPNPAWKLMLGILPTGHDSFSPSPPTRWRDFSADNPEIVTYALIGKGAEAITERLLQDVGTSVVRWTLLLDYLASLAPDRLSAIRKLAEAEPGIRSPADRAVLRDRVRRLLHHHREFPDAGWALPDEELSELEKIYDKLAPTDPIQQIAWLFNSSVVRPRPTAEGWESEEKEVTQERERAAQALLSEHGIDSIFTLARSVEVPGYIGAALANVGQSLRDMILLRAIRSEDAHDRDLGHGMIFAIFQNLKEPWAQQLLSRALSENWGTEAVLTIFLALPSRRWTWDQARAAGEEVETLYWRRAPRFWVEGGDADTIYAVKKLLKVERARYALDLIGRPRTGHLPSDLQVEVLLQLVNELRDLGPSENRDNMLQYHVSEILKKLDVATDVSEDTMLRLEWAYLPLLEYSQRPVKALVKALSERPEFFTEVICAVFKPTEESGIVEEPPANLERAQAIASQAYNLLRLANRVPGATANGSIDGEMLERWVKEVRILAKKKGRAEVADQKIGEMLSASPQDADGNWPAGPVRDAIEITRSADLETGFVIGHMNRRGVTMRMPRSGGELERNEAARFHGYSKALALEWPRTSAVLERISKSYEEDARRHDEDAERMDWR
jgi:transcriptional regulator with XRE-family HTH domain